MPQMRTINEAHRAIKQADPQTALTPHAIRQLILTGEIPFIRAGNKYLIDLEGLQAYLQNPQKASEPARNYGKIRAINERSARR